MMWVLIAVFLPVGDVWKGGEPQDFGRVGADVLSYHETYDACALQAVRLLSNEHPSLRAMRLHCLALTDPQTSPRARR
jgi:hypothetical protein